MLSSMSFRKLTLFLALSLIPRGGVEALAAHGSHLSAKNERKTKEQYRKEFFKFAIDLFRWAAKAKSKLNDGEPKQEIYFKFTAEDYRRLHSNFEKHRDVLYALGKYHDLNMINGQDVLPPEIYSFIKMSFALNAPTEALDKSQILLKIVGGEFSFANGSIEQVGGLLDKIDEFALGEWMPVRTFINQFKDTLTLDGHLALHLGRVLLPLMSHYYNYMDTISRLRLFKEIAEDYETIDLTGQAQHDREELAIRVFQSSGPVLIKYLQQLQEETIGETPISRVLEGLKYSKPMNPKTAEKLARQEISRITGARKVREFDFEQRALGIASIAQTHLFRYRGQPYIIKLLKDKIKDVFNREKEILRAILEDEKNEEDFDKGLKESIANMIAGIEEEIDFNFERRNLIQGKETYYNPGLGLQTVDLPAILRGKEAREKKEAGSGDALIMTVAPGEPLGDLMKRGTGPEIEQTYQLVQNLYREYITQALDERKKANFYHGDLHRENIFIDIDGLRGKGRLTLIDFGNAGFLSPRIRRSITNILHYTKRTNSSREKGQDQAIVDLASELRKFIIVENKLAKREGSQVVGLLNSFFSACFNPFGTLEEKMVMNKQISDRKRDLQLLKKSLQAELFQSSEKGAALLNQLRQVQDDVDFANALLGNCLNGVTNPLLTALASDNTVSEKLAIVFQELQKNGIALPKEVIFFNKSKSLLEGILTNLAQKLDDMQTPYEYREPEDIFDEVIHKVRPQRGAFKRFAQKLLIK